MSHTAQQYHDALDHILLHETSDARTVLGESRCIGPIEFLVRNWHNILLEFESESILLANKVCGDW
jgi:hypothetical protein